MSAGPPQRVIFKIYHVKTNCSAQKGEVGSELPEPTPLLNPTLKINNLWFLHPYLISTLTNTCAKIVVFLVLKEDF